MPADLTAYLASRYLEADKKSSKKRKRKQKTTTGDGGLLLITDDGDEGSGRTHGDDDDEYGAGAATVAGSTTEFRKAKTSSWKTLGREGATEKTAAGEKDAEADAIIAAAAADAAAEREAEDEAPAVVGEAAATARASGTAVLMSDGTHAGLQSAAAVTAQLERRRREEREQYEHEQQERRRRRREKKKAEGGGDGAEEEPDEQHEVVYRDATGRRIDVALRRQQVREAALEADRKEREAVKSLRGDVQREAARARREELEDAALLPVARGADDAELNAELKAQARWNDPMAAFLGMDAGGGKAVAVASKTAPSSVKKRSQRPVYTGPAAPNRYGIRPGYRWDGVDRGNGFEAERFKALNRDKRHKERDYAWQQDED